MPPPWNRPNTPLVVQVLYGLVFAAILIGLVWLRTTL